RRTTDDRDAVVESLHGFSFDGVVEPGPTVEPRKITLAAAVREGSWACGVVVTHGADDVSTTSWRSGGYRPRRTFEVMADMPTPKTIGDLRASGHTYRGVKAELRDNLLSKLRAGERTFAGIVGFDDTVVPALERALLAGHDIVLLGERGQGKTRLMRTLTTLLDEWTPVIDGSPLGEHPYAPVTRASSELIARHGDDL